VLELLRTDAAHQRWKSGTEEPLDMPEGQTPSAPLAIKPREASSIVRGVTGLVLSQLMTAPLGMLLSAVLARNLGPAEFGALYIGQTAVTLGFLFVEWGQGTAVAGTVAIDHARAGSLLGTSIALKVGLALAVTPLLLLSGWLQGYSASAQLAVAVLALQALFTALQASANAVLRGYERTDQVSVLSLVSSLLQAAMVIPAALAGLGLPGVLAAMTVSSGLLLPFTAGMLRKLEVPRLRVSTAELGSLITMGSGFLIMALVLALQPYIDATILARLAPAEVMGWHAASRRMIGVLIFPATTLSFAIYPTVARLTRESAERLESLFRVALRVMILTSVPSAVGTAVFAAPAVHLIYGTGRFEQVVPNLQILSGWVLLVYFTIFLGSLLMAQGRALAWSGVQSLCLVVSAAADPLLIPLFQRSQGNGALGVSVATVASEVLMLAFALFMVPRQMLGGRLWVTLLQALASGGAMALAGRPFVATQPLLGVVCGIGAYLAVLFALGGLRPQQFKEVTALLRAKVDAKVRGT
jgi:O-antigen/teichoic acid export membrane protein